METTCQDSYPLNSANARPFGTFTVYLSCAEIAQPATKASKPEIIEIVRRLLNVIGHTSALKSSSFRNTKTQFQGSFGSANGRSTEIGLWSERRSANA